MNIEPRLGKGLRDYFPEDMIPRQQMFKMIQRTFEKFGFIPLDTPGLELEEILTGGDPNFQKQIFKAGLKNSSEELALRFDLTVPLARVVAQYFGKFERTFRRYQMGKVWRGERPQAGRFREFLQFDADIVGTSMVSADAEIIALMYETIKTLGFEEFLIRVNNRKVLNGLPEYIGFDYEHTTNFLRWLDKLDKLGWKKLSSELEKQFDLTQKQLEELKKFLEFQENRQTETVAGIKELMYSSSTAMEGAEELEAIADHLTALGVPEEAWTIDLSVARGLGYYTGPVFETSLTNLPSIGSIFSGGRFDGLVSRFISEDVPCTGASVGVDRLFEAMKQLNLVEQKSRTAEVLVLNFDTTCEIKSQQAATQLRQAGIRIELYLGTKNSLKGQLGYAARKEFPVAVIIGPDEKKRGVSIVKDMNLREQDEVDLLQLTTKVKNILQKKT